MILVIIALLGESAYLGLSQLVLKVFRAVKDIGYLNAIIADAEKHEVVMRSEIDSLQIPFPKLLTLRFPYCSRHILQCFSGLLVVCINVLNDLWIPEMFSDIRELLSQIRLGLFGYNGFVLLHSR